MLTDLFVFEHHAYSTLMVIVTINDLSIGQDDDKEGGRKVSPGTPDSQILDGRMKEEQCSILVVSHI